MKPGLANVGAIGIAAVVAMVAEPCCGAPEPVEHIITLHNLPLLPFGGEYLIASTASGVVTTTEVRLELVTEGTFRGEYFVFEFFGPRGGIVVRGDELGWFGPGSFSTTFTTANLNGELTMQGHGPTLHYYFANASTTNFEFPGDGSLGATEIRMTIQPCLVDFSGDFQVSVQDVFTFLGEYFAGSARADVDGSGAVAVGDIFTFLTLYFAGCDAF